MKLRLIAISALGVALALLTVLAPRTADAASLTKVALIAVGVPILLMWQAAEGRRALAVRS
jgi:hypothetical protein